MKADQQQFVRVIELKDRTGRVIGQKEVVTYQGLLSKAHEEGLKAIHTTLLQIPSDENGRTAIAKAQVETEKGGFEALGDASPESVTSFLVPHLIRMAETRAKARALRDAVNVGVISFEELDGDDFKPEPSGLGSGAPNDPIRQPEPRRSSPPPRPAGTANGTEGPMSEAQRRYLFRLLAGQGYQGAAAEDYLRDRLGVPQLSRASRSEASALIDELIQSSAPGKGAGDGATTQPQR